MASLDEAKAVPTDFSGALTIMPDWVHGYIYAKALGDNGTPVFRAYRYEPPQATTAATINAPVVVTIGTGTEQYPLTNRCCGQVTACGIRTRTRYSAVVSTSATGGTFRLLGKTCPCPDNSLASINGTAPAAPVTPTA